MVDEAGGRSTGMSWCGEQDRGGLASGRKVGVIDRGGGRSDDGVGLFK